MAVGTLSSIKVDPVAGTFSAKYTADSSVSTTAVFCGFTPRYIKMTQIGGSPGATAQSLFHESMSAGYASLINNVGTMTIPTVAGYKVYTGGEASVATAASGSPLSAGPGFEIGTGVQTNSLIYFIEAVR